MGGGGAFLWSRIDFQKILYFKLAFERKICVFMPSCTSSDILGSAITMFSVTNTLGLFVVVIFLLITDSALRRYILSYPLSQVCLSDLIFIFYTVPVLYSAPSTHFSLWFLTQYFLSMNIFEHGDIPVPALIDMCGMNDYKIILIIEDSLHSRCGYKYIPYF